MFSSLMTGFTFSAERETLIDVLIRDSLPLSTASKILGDTLFGEAKS